MSIEGSVRFLQKYWRELCDIRQQEHDFDAKGKRPVHDSLIAGKREPRKREPLKWVPPSEGWIKINADGAYYASSGEGGLGIVISDTGGSSGEGGLIVISDTGGKTQLTAWKYINRGGDAEEVEALACAEGLKLAKDWCANRAVLETDCSTLVALFRERGGNVVVIVRD